MTVTEDRSEKHPDYIGGEQKNPRLMSLGRDFWR
jgi:hypothetical protein